MARIIKIKKLAPVQKARPTATKLERLVKDFLDHLEVEKNRSVLTRGNYDYYLRRFLTVARLADPAQITLDAVRDFRLWLHRQTDRSGVLLAASTQNYHLIALRSFLKYLAKRDIKSLASEKIELAKMPDRHIDILESAELERLLEAPMQTPEVSDAVTEKNIAAVAARRRLVQLRDKAILELLFSTGLRVSELAGLKKEDVNLNRDEFTVLGKGRKRRVVFLSEQAKYWLKKYLETRKDMSPFLFVNHDRAGVKRATMKEKEEGLTPRSIQRAIEKYARHAGIIKRVTPHVMRHSFATDLLRNGADIRSVQSMLGHSSITTTQIYTHITDKGLRDVHQRFHGKDRGLKGDSSNST
ncbi:MAG: hypothetical protein HW383_299 [Candidatus Magasanikbacteria bacterium]|nr:hypothetical protein [Candidatus Magasanikbacteria bacterium]